MALMDLDLTGEVALITAATSGIGLVVAEGLAAQGAEVWINGRSRERVDAAAARTRSLVPGASVQGVVGDVSTAEGVAAVTAKLPEVDILINTAGGTHRVAPYFDLTDEDWQDNFDFNVMSAVRLTRHYVPAMLKKNWGRIVLVSTNAAGNIPDELVNYGVTKAGVEALSRAVAELTVKTGVTCNCVVPGPTLTDWALNEAAAKGLTPEEFEQEFFPGNVASSLVQRFLTSGEVASMIIYVCSRSSSATNGAVLRAEGGILRDF